MMDSYTILQKAHKIRDINEISDMEIIQGLIDRNSYITEQFLFHNCKPLFHSIIRLVFSYEVNYDEFVNELYQYLKTLALRYFIKKRNELIANESKGTLYIESDTVDYESKVNADIDLKRLLYQMKNKRYAYVIYKLMIEEKTPDSVAKEINVTLANLYNIKKRAMAALTQVALKDIVYYDNKR